tara:strand:+ start:2496 stop:3203 length:708 start_codon:yes stop_codon:yes gene_type:complete
MNCPYCLRNYKLKIYYDRHVSVCKLLSDRRSENERNDHDNDETPTIRELYKLIQDLYIKNDKLEKEIQRMKKEKNNKIEDFDPYAWLSKNCSSEMNFDTWINSININDQHMTSIFENSIMHTIYDIIENNILIKKQNIPFIGLLKNNKFYVYEKEWKLMEDKHIEMFIDVIEKKIINYFILWQKNNKSKISANDKFQEKYLKIAQKVVEKKMKKRQKIKNVKNKILNIDLLYYKN